MRRLIADSYKLAAPHSYMLLGDLDWWRALLAEPDTYLPTIPLWFAGDTLVGFIWPAEGSGDICSTRISAPPNPSCWRMPSSTCASPPLPSAGIADAGEPGHRNPPQSASRPTRLRPQRHFLASQFLTWISRRLRRSCPRALRLRDMAGPSSCQIGSAHQRPSCCFPSVQVDGCQVCSGEEFRHLPPRLGPRSRGANGDFAAYCTCGLSRRTALLSTNPLAAIPITSAAALAEQFYTKVSGDYANLAPCAPT